MSLFLCSCTQEAAQSRLQLRDIIVKWQLLFLNHSAHIRCNGVMLSGGPLCIAFLLVSTFQNVYFSLFKNEEFLQINLGFIFIYIILQW